MRKQTVELLPPCVYRKHGAYFLVRKNKWHRLGDTLNDATAALAAFAGSEPSRLTKRWVDDIFGSRRSFARSHNVEFTITRDHVVELATAADFKCVISGIPFDLDWHGDYKRRPWKPSLDRIDPKRGYIPGNVRLVCAVANYAMNDWGLDVLLRLARSVVSLHRGTKIRQSPKNRQPSENRS
jgi:hypothetical protein